MLVSYNWLKRFIPDLDLTNDQIKEHLTQKTGEVENFSELRSNLSKIVCGEVLSLAKHPNSEHLNLVKVDVLKGANLENENLEIICGASNLYVGQKVAVCLVGGTVYSAEDEQQTVKISVKDVLGIKSSGMICSERELGISNQHDGIMELNPDTVVGLDLTKNGLEKDTVFEIENKSISHRGDLFSHIGIARELFAILGLKEIREVEHHHSITKNSNTNFPLIAKITTPNCKRFSAVAIKGVSIKQSPLWLQVKLLSVGIRPINNIVDITNYVMLDLGQPMHAYDYDKVSGNTLIARESAEGEKILTLDNVERILSKGVTVISDSEKVVGVGGIIGGTQTSITTNTTNIILEAANFERFNIRRSSRNLNVRTEASGRFEKGFDPESTMSAITYAMSLVLDIAGGEIASEIVDIYPEPENEKIIEFDINKVNRVLGIQVNRDEVLDILKKLYIDTSHAAFVKVDGINPVVNTSYVNVVIPSFRRDLNIPEDLLEEIARMYGYSNISPTLPLKDIAPKSLNNFGKLSRKIKKILITNGISEIYSYSFVSDILWKKCNLNTSNLLKVTNPLMPELSYMRNDLIPSLLETLSNHINAYGDEEYTYFEINRIIKKTYDDEHIHEQPWTLGIVRYSSKDSKKLDILPIIDQIFRICNIDYKIKNFADIDDRENIRNIELFHKSQSGIAYIEQAKENVSLAKFGKIDQRIKDNFKFPEEKNIEIASINLDILTKLYLEQTNYQPVSDKEFDYFDFSLNLPDNFESQKILEIANKIDGVINTTYIDRYIKDEINSLTIRITAEKGNIDRIKIDLQNKINVLEDVNVR